MERIVKVVKVLGYPVFISLVLFYFCFCTLERNTKALVALDKSIGVLTELIKTEYARGPNHLLKDF